MSDPKDFEHSYYLAKADIKRLEARVEELEGFRATFLEGALKARVEELEADCAVKDDIIQGYGHVLTPEMIDAAVECATAPSDQEWERTHWELLNKLNIFRCENEHCYGGKIPPAITGAISPLPGRPCPDCAKFTGHGWTIGDPK